MQEPHQGLSSFFRDAPEVHILHNEGEYLRAEAPRALADNPAVLHLLQEKLRHATFVSRDRMPARVVMLYSNVEFFDQAAERIRWCQVVYPNECNIGAGRVSVLSPIGAGLIGLAETHAASWPLSAHEKTVLTVRRVCNDAPWAL